MLIFMQLRCVFSPLAAVVLGWDFEIAAPFSHVNLTELIQVAKLWESVCHFKYTIKIRSQINKSNNMETSTLKHCIY